MKNNFTFSKNNYLAGIRCAKNLFLQQHNPELEEVDASSQAIIAQGREFELVARDLIAPGGFDLSIIKNQEERIARTIAELKKKNCVLYQATFCNDSGELAMADVIIKKDGITHLIEIKMTTSLDGRHYHDASFQFFVATTSGFKIDKVSIAYINKNYVRGASLTSAVLIVEDVTKAIKRLDLYTPKKVEGFKKILKRKEAPDKDLGMHCTYPNTCSFKNHCWNDLPTNSIFELKSIRLSKKLGLHYKGIDTIDQLARNEKGLTDRQIIHVTCALENKKAVQWEAIEEWFKPLRNAKGIYYLDFETSISGLPLYKGCKPFTQIVTQYSLHYLDKKTNELVHMDFLAEPGEDPRREFIKSLLLDINLFDDYSPIVVYNKTFEKTRLRELADLFPEYDMEIEILLTRIVDLMDIFRSYYYDPRFNGGYSIKSVLPVLCPGLDYSDLEIKNGSIAAYEYSRLTNLKSDEAKKIKYALKEYCKRDTFAMVRLLQQLEHELYEYCKEKTNQIKTIKI